MNVPSSDSPAETVTLTDADLALVSGVLAGQRRALAKAITLIESTREDHQIRAQQVLNALLPKTGNAIRIGISGVPGAGMVMLAQPLDKAVDAAYLTAEKAAGRKPPRLTTDAERVAFLFERYQQLTSLLPTTKPKRKPRKKV